MCFVVIWRRDYRGSVVVRCFGEGNLMRLVKLNHVTRVFPPECALMSKFGHYYELRSPNLHLDKHRQNVCMRSNN